jgi:hypothetical protein
MNIGDIFLYEFVGALSVITPFALMYFIGNAIDSKADLSDKYGLGFSFLLLLSMLAALFFFVGRAILL